MDKKRNNHMRMKMLLKMRYVPAMLFVLMAGPMAHASTSPSLGVADSYSVLSGTAGVNVGATTITGDVGVAPGLSFSGGVITYVTPGNPHLPPTADTAMLANTAAFTSLGTLNPDADCIGGVLPSATDLTAAFPAGIAPGTYCSAGSFLLTGNLNLTGTGVYVFKMVSTLITSPGSSITGGNSCNIWWRVGSSATIETTTAFKGNILASTAATMKTGATLDGRIFAQTANVTLGTNTVTIPTCAAAPVTPPLSGTGLTGTINVVKVVINDNGGTRTIANFPLFVNGALVISGATNSFPAPASAYTVSETSNANYTQTISGDCDPDGRVSLSPGQNKFCIITNNDIGAPVVVPPVPPLIDVVKVPNPLALPAGPGIVQYTYTVRNIGTVPMHDVTMVGDTCSPITLVSGDTNSNSILEVSETWVYRCSVMLSATHTNTVVATGWANGLSAVDIASATVVVGLPIVPPLIHVTKVPNPLTLHAGGGMVTYTNKVTNPGTVALSNVLLSDDKCSPVTFVSGDTNGNSMLEPTETWTYTCSANLTQTTTNTVIASGEANGLTARDFAIVTVVVATAAPALPNTGFDPSNALYAWMVASAALIAATLLIALTQRKRYSR